MDTITVLIVDDSSVMRKILERSLRQAGLEIGRVFEASNGLEALAVMNEQKVNRSLRYQHACHGWFGIRKTTAERGKREGSTGCHDYHRRQRGPRSTGFVGRRTRLHS
jgi:CheY-like chemotaxis protein